MNRGESKEDMAFDRERVEQVALLMRQDIVRMVTEAGSGHPGGSLSAVDILATLYFGEVMQHRAEEPDWDGRDRFILSKGHAAPVLYAALAHVGYFEREELLTLRRFGTRLQGHPDSRLLPGVEVSTGSLGQGLSVAAGLAAGLGVGSTAEPIPYVYVLLGDGELQEGQVWEAAMFAAHSQLENLVAIVDNNGLQIDGAVSDINCLGSIEDKFKAFGWRVLTCADGHDTEELKRCFDEASCSAGAPTLIIADTVKGKGVRFMEGQCGWHGKAPSVEQCAVALEELGV